MARQRRAMGWVCWSGKQPKAFTSGMAYDQILHPYWLAYALRKMKQDVAALEACQTVTEQQDLAQGLDPDAAAWYYRAGFLAVELLEERKQWEGAARMAERLAQAGGERATEAQDIATKIRLQRFLWDEKR